MSLNDLSLSCDNLYAHHELYDGPKQINLLRKNIKSTQYLSYSLSSLERSET